VDQHKQALIQGLATGLGFVGVMGFAIDSSKWPILLTLLGMSVALVIVSTQPKKEKND
jgi:hypothetical protein